MKRAKRHLEICEDLHCRFIGHTHKDDNPVCCFGLRNSTGCCQEDDAVMDRADEIRHTAMQAMLGMKTQKGEHITHYNDAIRKKFEFVFNGHHYKASDSARNQSRCPHCDKRAEGQVGSLWSKKSKAYIGCYNKEIYCFECPSCFKKFYYHNGLNTLFQKDTNEVSENG